MRWELLLSSLALSNLFVAGLIYGAVAHDRETRLTLLDVGQGDASLIELSGGVEALIDGGPGRSILYALEEARRPTDRYIDLVILSHANLDHYGGLADVVDRLKVGAFIYNGQVVGDESFRTLRSAIERRGIPVVVLGRGSRLRYRDAVFDILSPSLPEVRRAKQSEANELSLIVRLRAGGVRALFTGDIGKKTERALVARYGASLASEILKVPHHGSKNASSAEFLRAVSPKVALIGVGKNRYGHPTREALDRLALIGARVLRADRDGTVTLRITGGALDLLASFP